MRDHIDILLNRKRLYIPLLLFSLTGTPFYAAINKFTYLDSVNGWTIERKIDSLTNQVFCRASIFEDGNWFADRVRLGINNEVIIPNRLKDNSELYLAMNTSQVKDALERCNSGVLYLP